MRPGNGNMQSEESRELTAVCAKVNYLRNILEPNGEARACEFPRRKAPEAAVFSAIQRNAARGKCSRSDSQRCFEIVP